MRELSLGRNSFLKFLSDLEANIGESQQLVTAYITQKSSDVISKLPEPIGSYSSKVLERHPLGMVAFSWAEKNINVLVFPPFPISEEYFSDSMFRTEQLRGLFDREMNLAVILLNMGEYAMGIFENGKLIDSKVGKRYLRGRHGKGGMSQNRYLRLRRMYAGIFFKEVMDIIRERLEPKMGMIDYVVYGGAPTTIRSFQEIGGFVDKINEKALGRIIEAKEVSKKAIDEIMYEVWKTRITEL